MRILVGAALLGASLASSGMSPAWAQSSIRVLVNDKPITSYDVKNRAQMLRVFSQGKQGEKQALEQLIDEKLMVEEAARRNVTVSDAEVEQEFAQRAQGAKMSPERFSAALRQVGVDPQTFKDYIRANMAWGEIVRRRFRATVEVSEVDVAAAIGSKEGGGEQTQSTEYMLQQILFVVPEKGKNLEGQRLGEAKAFRGGFKGCDQSLQQANGMPGVVVKPTVRREEQRLSDSLKEALKGLEVGGITEPQRVAEGFQLVAVCDKKAIPGQTQESVEARAELTSERGKLLARRYLKDLRADASIEYK
jgi:peptidyl-prolyl cis-trans isomerase SurA